MTHSSYINCEALGIRGPRLPRIASLQLIRSTCYRAETYIYTRIVWSVAHMEFMKIAAHSFCRARLPNTHSFVVMSHRDTAIQTVHTLCASAQQPKKQQHRIVGKCNEEDEKCRWKKWNRIKSTKIKSILARPTNWIIYWNRMLWFRFVFFGRFFLSLFVPASFILLTSIYLVDINGAYLWAGGGCCCRTKRTNTHTHTHIRQNYLENVNCINRKFLLTSRQFCVSLFFLFRWCSSYTCFAVDVSLYCCQAIREKKECASSILAVFALESFAGASFPVLTCCWLASSSILLNAERE